MTRDPFKLDGPTCISFSGGRTSGYMLWRVLQSNGGLPGSALVCFANTGKEEEATLEFVRDCGAKWNVPIAWVEYRNNDQGFALVDFESASRNGEPFEALIEKKQYLPNPVARFCTQELKVNAIDRYLKSVGIDDAEMMVGIRADEPVRIAKLRARGLLLPLVDAGITQTEVQDFWKSQPFNLGLRFANGVTPLSNCDLCFLKGPRQIFSIIADKPSRALWWGWQERKVCATFRSDRPNYTSMLNNAYSQQDFFGHDEESIPCFCGE